MSVEIVTIKDIQSSPIHYVNINIRIVREKKLYCKVKRGAGKGRKKLVTVNRQKKITAPVRLIKNRFGGK